MAEVKIPENLWQDFVAMARQQRAKPEALAEKVLRDYLQRVADEDLLAHSERSVRRQRFRVKDTEEIICQYRRETKKL